MTPTKITAIVFLALIFIFLGNGIYYFSRKNYDSEKRYSELKSELNQTQADYDKIQNSLNYYSNPDNLEKELRAKFNYREVGEKMIIIVPPASSTDR